jgi:hypothetical protein
MSDCVLLLRCHIWPNIISEVVYQTNINTLQWLVVVELSEATKMMKRRVPFAVVTWLSWVFEDPILESRNESRFSFHCTV